MSQSTVKIHERYYGQLTLHENGILYLDMYDDVSFNIIHAEQLVTDVRSLDNSGHASLLILQAKNNDMSFEAQRYLGKVTGVTHLALVVRSKIQAEVGQFFVSLMKVLRSPYEMRIFYQLDMAEAWLLEA